MSVFAVTAGGLDTMRLADSFSTSTDVVQRVHDQLAITKHAPEMRLDLLWIDLANGGVIRFDQIMLLYVADEAVPFHQWPAFFAGRESLA